MQNIAINHHAISTEEMHMATGNIAGLFVKFGLPGICGILFISLQSLVDALLLGRFVGASALASVNITIPLFTVFWAICVAAAVGNEFQMSYALGQGRRKDAADAFTTGVAMLLVLSLVWLVPCLFFAPEIVKLAGASPLLEENSAAYLATLAGFMPIAGMVFLGDYTLKALGKPMRAVLIMSSIVIANVVLDILFIVVFGWGVRGAALATGLSYSLGFCLNFIPFLLGRMEFGVFKGRVRPRMALRMLYNGSSEGLGESMAATTTLLFNLTIISYAKENGVAAYTALGYLSFIATAVFLGTSDGIRPVVSYNYGRRNFKRMISMLRLTIVSLSVFGLVLFSLLFFGGEMLVGLFFGDGDAEAAAFAAGGAKIFAFTFLVSGFNILVSGYFTSIGNAKVSAFIALLHGLVFVVIGLWLYPQIWGVNGIWMVMPLSALLTFLVAAPLMYRSIKNLK